MVDIEATVGLITGGARRHVLRRPHLVHPAPVAAEPRQADALMDPRQTYALGLAAGDLPR
jgi:hypothetical protein